VVEVAVMSYDSAVTCESSRLATEAVPPPDAETVAAAVRGTRLAMADGRTGRRLGVAFHADFSAEPGDWSAYFDDWVRPGP
jgi:hypothetical protein